MMIDNDTMMCEIITDWLLCRLKVAKMPAVLYGTKYFSFINCLRIPDSYDAKIAKIPNLWTFWPVIQSINQKGLLSAFEKIVYLLIYRPECPEVTDLR